MLHNKEMNMSVRLQVILDEEEAARFRSQAKRESKSLSAWLRDAGKEALEQRRRGDLLNNADDLRKFFDECAAREEGVEPEWEEHKKLIIEGFQEAKRP
jgi:hypothetical protein